ncbi:MAG TPA: NAD-dependent succinate-semialdehyde dehydrogenase [Atribacteraceae bacterium]|nr:NAD-dependent succinate-semialdehyde dehydrogenase [Atribacteraceae bacterium]
MLNSQAFREWSAKTPFERARFLEKAALEVERKAEEIGKVMSSEQGKPLAEAIGEVKGSVEVIRYFAEAGKRTFGEIIPLDKGNLSSIVIRQPIGVVAAITPWNYPVQLLAWKVGAALAAGCTVVAKVPSETPLSPLMFLRCLVDTGLPKGIISGVAGPGSTVGKGLALHPLVKKVSFTGSTEAGKKIMEYCAGGVKRVTLELGGQCPLLVLSDADLEKAVKGGVKRSFRNMGQVCNSINRIYVENSIYDQFLAMFVEETKKYRIGNGLLEEVDLGPMVSLDALRRVQEHVEDARAKGARVLAGGKKPAGEKYRKGYYFEPTVIGDVHHDMLVMKEETFGPVVGVMPFDNVTQAITWANDTRYGLAAYVYTSNLDRARQLCLALECGNVGLNNVDVATIYAPYGGWKESGFGSDLGPEGISSYQEVKHIKIEFNIA